MTVTTSVARSARVEKYFSLRRSASSDFWRCSAVSISIPRMTKAVQAVRPAREATASTIISTIPCQGRISPAWKPLQNR